MIPGSANPLLLATAAPTGYNIERSLRFNSADSAYLSRTPASSGNRKTWTWAGWVKRSGLGTSQYIFESRTGASDTTIMNLSFNASNQLQVVNYSYFPLISTSAYRDTSAWYHIVWSLDTTQATASNRMKLYVNGAEITTFGTDNRSSLTQNSDQAINQAAVHYIGGQNYLAGYLADIHLVDGQALTPTSFGEFDVNNVWQPKAYTGSYGTNGFKINFSNNSAATAAALGADSSGNGNNWTPTNLSVTAGAGNDSLVDTPTSYGTDTGVGGEVRGNYCTWNPLHSTSGTLSNGNLDFTAVSSTWSSGRGSIHVSSGKWYWEIVCPTITSSVPVRIGIMPGASYSGVMETTSGAVAYCNNGQKQVSGTQSAYGAVYVGGDVIGVALDLDNGTIVFYRNGSSQGTAASGLSGSYCAAIDLYLNQTSGASVANFGARSFAYTAPSGFKALCTANLPTPTIANGATAMDVALWTGTSTGSTSQTISGLAFSPDLVWLKNRTNGGAFHVLNDTNRGANRRLSSNSTAAEEQNSLFGYLSAFTSDGFTLTPGTSGPDLVCQNGVPYVAWTWDAGSSTVTNTQGSITSQVRANASAGFSIVTYTGNGTAGATIGHGLGVAPQLIITKARSGAVGWAVYHQATGNTQFLSLESTAAASTNSTAWNNTSPSSTVVTFGTGTLMNANTSTYVAYCFAPVAGFSAFGSYTGNGSATDGPFVFCNFRPRWILVKSTGATGWAILDTGRNSFNQANSQLFPHASDAELTSATDYFNADILSNGFKLRSASSGSNTNGQTYLYAAFAEHPFSASRAR